MHLREPWQSRSPTGAVNKPAISTTLEKTGRRGLNHSYGRGLPVKRKALIILSIAILAFAMVPALGAGAAAGTVKLVTPDELAGPSGSTGSSFDRLDSADFVSDSTGRDTLEDAGGTLYVVIEDNDSSSNTLTDYYAYFTDRPATADGGGNAYVIDPAQSGTTPNPAVATAVTESDGTNVANAADLQIGDRNRNGSIDAGDLLIETGYYVSATGAFEAVRTVNVQNAFVSSSTNGKEAYLSLNIIPTYPTGRVTGEVGALRIRFASATIDNLNYATDHATERLRGLSRVVISSTSGESIRVTATEKNLGGFGGAAVDASGLAANSSRDSGIFVGMFGVIRNDFKEALSDWEPAANEDTIQDLIDDINDVAVVDGAVTGATGPSEAFESFCDPNAKAGQECAEQGKLVAAIQAHTDNLGLDGGDAASQLVGMLIGVEHGDTLEVNYSDANPRSTRSRDAEVDLVAPTIGDTSLASGAYVDEDDFSLFFTVTDADSGIPEDAHDLGEQAIRSGLPYVSQSSGGAPTGESFTLNPNDGTDQNNFSEPNDDATLDVDDEVADGERYEIEFDVTNTVQAAEGDENTDARTVTIQVRILAYDIARNEASKTLTFIIDDIDPELLRAITGVSVKAAKDTADPYELNDQNRKSIVLVFDDAIAGNDVNAQDINVVGNTVAGVMWLDNTGSNKIGSAGTAGSDIRGDLGDIGSGDARHLLFLTLENDLPTDARPGIEIDNADLRDLAGNESRVNHRTTPADKLAPVFTVTVGTKLSNNDLSVTIESSEDLERAPSARLRHGTVNEALPVRGGSNNTWTVDTNRRAENLGGTNRSGVYTIHVEGTDDNNNDGSSSKAKWELDTLANGGVDPARVYDPDAASAAAQPIEVNDVVFLNFDFSGEAGEYDDDSAKTVSVTGLALQSLSADSLDSSKNLKAASSVTVTETTEVDGAAAQTSNSIRYVVALSDLAIGNYRLNVDYEDQAGNTDTFGYVFRITAPAPAKVAVVPGWSLVSIPGTPQDTSISGVFEGSAVTDVWSLNNETKQWEYAGKDPESGEWLTGTLTNIVDGRAYFVRSTTFDPISVLTVRFSPQRTPPQYTVTSGWNGIGYTPAGGEDSVSADAYLSALGASGWGMIRTWNADATPPQYETYFSSGAMTDGFPHEGGVAVVESGKGYLLFATRNGVIGG